MVKLYIIIVWVIVVIQSYSSGQMSIIINFFFIESSQSLSHVQKIVDLQTSYQCVLYSRCVLMRSLGHEAKR